MVRCGKEVMKIGIDARNYTNPQKSGVDIYVSQLIENVPRLDTSNEYTIYVHHTIGKEQASKLSQDNVRLVKVPLTKHYKTYLKYHAKYNNMDFVHFPVAVVPEGMSTPYLISVLDLTFEFYPEFYERSDLIKQKNTIVLAEGAFGIIAISESTKDDIVKVYGISPEKIEVTHLALKKDKIDNYKYVNLDSGPGYLLFVGNIQPRKNLQRVVGALSHIPKAKRPKLIMVGNIQNSPELRKIQDSISEKGLEDSVSFTGHLPEKELSDLYLKSRAIIYPSIYEGFGYNILEAFYYAKPIITSKTSSMSEIAKDAAYYVDPFSEKDIARGILEMLSDEKLNSDKVSKGKKYLKEYTVDKMAKSTIKAYKRLYEKQQINE